MRARDIMLFIICVSVAAPIVLNMGVFSTGPAGAGTNAITFTSLALAIGLLAGGGVSLFLFNFKIPAVLTVYSAMYVGSIAMMETLILQMIPSADIAAIVSIMFITLTGIVGVLGALEISGGAHGPME